MKLVRLTLALIVLAGVFASLTTAKPEYARKEGKKCVDCHEGGNPKKFTAMGRYYKEHDHSLEGYKAEEKK